MIQNKEIQEELIQLGSPLAQMPGTVPYALPAGYFESLGEALVRDVLLIESAEPVLNIAGGGRAPFAVPETYFTDLAEALTQMAAGSGITDVQIAAPFQAPGAYFDTLPDTLLAAAKGANAPKRKVISFQPQWRLAARFAAAAVLVLGLGFGSYQYFRPAQPEAIASKQLSKIDGDVLNDYVEQHADEFETETLEASVASAGTDDLHASLSSLNDAEIKDYLDETGEGDIENLN